MACLSLLFQQRVELARVVKRIEVIAAAHMAGPDEDLRHRGTAVRPSRHLGPELIVGNVDLLEFYSLLAEQLLGPTAIGTVDRSVDLDSDHSRPRSAAQFYMGACTVSTTRANTSASTAAAPARSSARAQASTVAPEVSTS